MELAVSVVYLSDFTVFDVDLAPNSIYFLLADKTVR
jgi:hypothetical protein